MLINQSLSNSASAQWTSIDGSSAFERNGTATPAYNDYFIGPATTTVVVDDANTTAKTRLLDTYDAGDDEVRLECANYCVAGLMSRCSAGTVWNEQKKCKYAEKSTVSNRCMHYIEAIDGHCDCEEAQRELRCSHPAKADTL